jgi:hypothetical protein
MTRKCGAQPVRSTALFESWSARRYAVVTNGVAEGCAATSASQAAASISPGSSQHPDRIFLGVRSLCSRGLA